MLHHDRPYEFKIDPEVLVDDNIAERDDLPPENFRVSLTQFRGYTPASFAQQRHSVQDRALNDQVVEESFPSLFGETGDQFYLFDGIKKTEGGPPSQ